MSSVRVAAATKLCESTSDVGRDVPPRVRKALALLLEGFQLAADVSHNPWDFALDLTTLVSAELSVNDCRWLTCKGLVEHAREITMDDDDLRQFCPEGRLAFSEHSCFVLTETGLDFALRLRHQVTLAPNLPLAKPPVDRDCPADVPVFHYDRRELKFCQRTVKRFRLEAPNQERILIAFQEEHWPVRIDDPLPPRSGMDTKQRLAETIKSLNRHQKAELIHFSADGKGEGICWESCATFFDDSSSR